jgi:branched-chain amino acid transport system ATP-binding protein
VSEQQAVAVPTLEIEGLHTYYGESHILRGVSLTLGQGRVVAVLGRNGCGKSTLVKSVVGWVPARQGTISLYGEQVQQLPSYQVVREGAAIVPQGRRIFRSLSVLENLTMGARPPREGAVGREWTLDAVWELFPQLKDRRRNRGDQLSGGEQSMLSIARALMTNPRLLLMDEPSEGLSPQMVKRVSDVLGEIKQEGLSILLAEQNLHLAMAAADELYILSKGEIVYHGTPAGLKQEPQIMRQYLGLGL